MCSNYSVSVDCPSLPHRFISAVSFIAALERVAAASSEIETRCELDSHTDTCVGGSNTVLIGLIQSRVTVSAFAPGYGKKDFPMGTVGTVWTEPNTGVSYLLVIHQAIFLGDELKHSLINPNQLRANGLQVDDCPQQFDHRSTHSIIIDEPEMTIPLDLRGIISYFPSRKPTQEEIQTLEQVHLTGTA